MIQDVHGKFVFTQMQVCEKVPDNAIATSNQRRLPFEGTDKLVSSDRCNLVNFVQATAAFHSLNALILRFR